MTAMTHDAPLRLGIDLGGSKIHVALVDAGGAVLATARRKTKAEKGYNGVLERIAKTTREVLDQHPADLDRIGIGVPGPVEHQRGVVKRAVNLGWEDERPLQEDLGRILGCEVVADNDVNLGALGEHRFGAARGAQSSYAMFVGTGLGGGYVYRDRVVGGHHGLAGEIGHIRSPFTKRRCGCGATGCLEMIASKQGIQKHIQEAAKDGRTSVLDPNNKLRSSKLAEAVSTDDAETLVALDRLVEGLAWGVRLIQAACDPEVFVFGGGIMEGLGDRLLSQLHECLANDEGMFASTPFALRLAARGDDAVALGAAALASQEP